MSGICAIYSGFSQSRQPILSLTSTAIRSTAQIHVRRNSALACARDTTIVSPIRKVHALSSVLSVKQFGGSYQTVSRTLFFYCILIKSIVRKKIKVKSIDQHSVKLMSQLSSYRNLLIRTGSLGNSFFC